MKQFITTPTKIGKQKNRFATEAQRTQRKSKKPDLFTAKTLRAPRKTVKLLVLTPENRFEVQILAFFAYFAS
jgi:hypothetical protein